MHEYKIKFPIINIDYSVLVYNDPLDLEKKFKDVHFDVKPKDFQAEFFDIDNYQFGASLMTCAVQIAVFRLLKKIVMK